MRYKIMIATTIIVGLILIGAFSSLEEIEQKEVYESKEVSLTYVTKDNYKKVTSKYFGLELNVSNEWLFNIGQSLDGESNLNLSFDIAENPDAKKEINRIYNQTEKVSGENYSIKIIDDEIKKGKSYNSFEEFFQNEGIDGELLETVSASWMYEYKSQKIIVEIDINDKIAEVSFKIK